MTKAMRPAKPVICTLCLFTKFTNSCFRRAGLIFTKYNQCIFLLFLRYPCYLCYAWKLCLKYSNILLYLFLEVLWGRNQVSPHHGNIIVLGPFFEKVLPFLLNYLALFIKSHLTVCACVCVCTDIKFLSYTLRPLLLLFLYTLKH